LPGAWTTEATSQATERELPSVLKDRILLGLRLGHPIPPVTGISLDDRDAA
jgi:hypothetical protein